MASLDLYFPWKVCTRGYEVREISKPGKRHRTLAEDAIGQGLRIAPTGKQFRAKSPLRHRPTLYLDFAALDEKSVDACIEFANEHGLLTAGSDPIGESYTLWQGQIVGMRRKIRQWQIDIITLAAGEKDEIAVGELTVVLSPSPPDEHLEMRVRPKHLLGAMELQLAASVAAGRELRACKQCGQFFEIGPGAKRGHAEFCSSKHQIDFNNAKKLRGASNGEKSKRS